MLGINGTHKWQVFHAGSCLSEVVEERKGVEFMVKGRCRNERERAGIAGQERITGLLYTHSGEICLFVPIG